MNLNLSILFDNAKTSQKISGDVEVSELNQRIKKEDFTILDKIKYDGEIYKTYDGYYIDMDINYTYQTSCARCLIDTKRENNIKLSGKLEDYEKAYERLEDIVAEDEGEVLNVEEDIYYEDNHLNLKDYIYIEVASSLPMKTVCSEDCKGLCMKCGIDLNKKTCDCDTDFIDPRLAKLKNFVIED